jgi:diguanylate cyclase (GGDEF)-like protein
MSLPEDFRELGEGLVYFAQLLKEVRDIARSLSRGDLSCALPSPDNELASNLKSLHATLKHLTWQAQEVAAGDYDQHVDFLGEFASAFNQMIAQLRERRDAMLNEIEIIQKQRQDLERSNKLFEIITSRLSEWIIIIDLETGERLFTNHPVKSVLASDIFESRFYDILLNHTKDIKENNTQKTVEFPMISNTTVQWFSAILHPLHWHEHNAVAALLTDITANKAQIEELEGVAYQDMLTGVYNRHYGMKLLNEQLEQHIPFVICFIDMDRLKYVNDIFGHVEGDRYILQVAKLLRTFSTDVSRLGGDEFMVMSTDVTQKEAEARLEALRNILVAKDYTSDDGKISYKCSMSYGVVEVTVDNTLPAVDLLSLADEKMFAYKKAHKAERRDAPA